MVFEGSTAGLALIVLALYLVIRSFQKAREIKEWFGYIQVVISVLMLIAVVMVYTGWGFIAILPFGLAVLVGFVNLLFFKKYLQVGTEKLKEKEAKGEIKGFSKWALDTLKEGPFGAVKFFFVYFGSFIVIYGLIFYFILGYEKNIVNIVGLALVFAIVVTLVKYHQVKKLQSAGPQDSSMPRM